MLLRYWTSIFQVFGISCSNTQSAMKKEQGRLIFYWQSYFIISNVLPSLSVFCPKFLVKIPLTNKHLYYNDLVRMSDGISFVLMDVLVYFIVMLITSKLYIFCCIAVIPSQSTQSCAHLLLFYGGIIHPSTSRTRHSPLPPPPTHKLKETNRQLLIFW